MGELGLHPWEFYEYELSEYLLKRKGYYRGKRIAYQNMLVASLVPHMKKEDRGKIMISAFKEDKGAGLSLKEQYERIQKKYESIEGDDLKVSNSGKRNKNINRR
jgi:hypothetical protein